MVIVSSVTTPETIYIFYALNMIGAVSNMVDPRTSIEGIHDYISEVNSKIVISLDVAYPKIIKAVEGTDVERIIITSPSNSLLGIKKVLYGLKNRPPKLSQNSILWDDFILKGVSNDITTAPCTKDECCVIVHTGGTTGMSKGVMLSNDNINALVQQSILTEIDMQRVHTWMNIMPPFIAYGIGMGIHLPLVIGMETILIPAFDADKFDSLLVKHKPIHMVFVPSYWGTIINSNGTSFATPMLAGLAACLWSALPTENAMQIRERILRSADRYATPDATQYGYGIPDAWIAYTMDMTAVEPIYEEEPPRKILRGEQILILRHGHVYNLAGQRIE